MHKRLLPSVRKVQKGVGVFFLLIFCIALYDVISVFAPLISSQLKTTKRPRYEEAALGGRHRQTDSKTVNISCLQRFSAHGELGTTWNTVWWLNQVVRNQLDETLRIKGTECILSLLSVGSHSSERIGDCFGPQKRQRVKLHPALVILCSQAFVTKLCESTYILTDIQKVPCLSVLIWNSSN